MAAASAWEKEYRQVWRQERRFLRKYGKEKRSLLDQKLDPLVPAKLRETLHAAFIKAFTVVFEKGTGAIDAVSRQEERRRACQVRRYAADLQENRKNLRAFSKAAGAAGRVNLALAGAEGIGLGLLGIGMPDVPLFAAMVLKSVYETAASFGFPYDTPEERGFVLRLLEAALSRGEELERCNAALNRYMQEGRWPEPAELPEQIRRAARRLSGELLYMKFLQGIPVAGAAGGAYDAVCLHRVQTYAAMKYRRRFLLDRRLQRERE